MRNKPIPVTTIDPKFNGRVRCGFIIGETFVKEVKSNNYMRVVDGYGIQENVIQGLGSHGVKTVRINNKETNRTYTAPLKTWLEVGKAADYGNGLQRFLSLKYLSETKL